MLIALQLFTRMGMIPDFNMLMGILDHHHGGIDHRADGNGDTAQRHDIGVNSLIIHDDKSDQDTDRQRDDGH